MEDAPAGASKRVPDSTSTSAQIKEVEQEVADSGELQEKQNEKPSASSVEEVKKTVEEACGKTAIDTRKESRIVFPFDELACVAMMSSLSGRSDAYSMSQYYTTHKEWLDGNLLSPDCPTPYRTTPSGPTS